MAYNYERLINSIKALTLISTLFYARHLGTSLIFTQYAFNFVLNLRGTIPCVQPENSCLAKKVFDKSVILTVLVFYLVKVQSISLRLKISKMQKGFVTF